MVTAKLTAGQRAYKERFWRGYKKPEKFGDAFKRTENVRREINKEIGFMVTRKTEAGAVSQTSGNRRLWNMLVAKLRKINDSRQEPSISEYKQKQLRRKYKETGRPTTRYLRVFWTDLTREEMNLFVIRIVRKSDKLSQQDGYFAEQIAKGLSETPMQDAIEQQERVLDELEEIYTEEIEKGGLPYGDPSAGYRTESGRDTGVEKGGLTKHEPTRAQKQWALEREEIADTGMVSYGFIFFLVFLFGAVVWMAIKKIVSRKKERESSYLY